VGIQVEYGDNTTYHMIKIGTISFTMPSGNILDWQYVFYVPKLMNNLLSISSITNRKHIVEFNDQKCIIRYYNHAFAWFLAKGVLEGCLCKLLVNTTKHDTLVHDSGKL